MHVTVSAREVVSPRAGAWNYDQYIAYARDGGDDELADFFGEAAAGERIDSKLPLTGRGVQARDHDTV